MTAFREQAAALAEAGVDLFLLETFSDLEEIRQAIEGCHAASDLPVVAQVTIQPNGETTYGDQPEQIAEAVGAMGVEAIGLNCSVGPAIILAAIQKMAGVTELPLSAVPNAGLPQEVHGRKIYLADPEYMAGYARRLVQAGVRIVGGCCGTTPAHIREMATQIRVVAQRAPRVRVGPTDGGESPTSAAVRGEEATEAAPIADRSAWGRKLAAGEMATSVEILPPRGTDASGMLESCRWLKEAGVDAVNVPDGARAMMRMGVIAASALIEREIGIETVAHYCCRDRNLLGMMSDLIGAQALGSEEHAADHGRSAEDGPVSGRDGGLRHRFGGTDQPGLAPQPRPGPRRQCHGQLDLIRGRRGRESGSRGSG